MAKITRLFQRAFGSNGLASNQFNKFGSFAAGTPTTTADPAEMQSLSNWLDGWFGAVVGRNAPVLEDLNALCYVAFYQLAYILQQGVAEWDISTTYYIGSMVNESGVLFVSLVDSNIANATTDPTYWYMVGGKTLAKTADYPIVVADVGKMIEVTASSVDIAMTLPTASSAKYRRFTITKMDATAKLVTVSDGTFTQILAAQYDSVTVYSNGSVYYAI